MNKKNRWFFNRRTLSNLAVVAAGVLLYLGFSNLASVRSTVGGFLSVFSPFVNGIAIAFLLNMPMRFFERKLFGRIQRPGLRRVLAIIITYLLALLVVAILLGLILPQVVDSIRTLVGNLPRYLDNLNDLVAWLTETFSLDPVSMEAFVVSYKDLLANITSRVVAALPELVNALPELLNLTMQISSGIVGAFTALMSSIYMLGSKEKLLLQCKRVMYSLLPVRRAKEIYRISSLSNRVFSGFISGKILDSAIIGMMCFIFMLIFGMPFSPLISVIIGVTNIIPFFGPIIGAIPSAMILLLVDPWHALWFVVFIILLQQFDGNVLGPKILGDSTGLPAFWVLVAIIVGGGLFGFSGMVLGVPTVAVLYTMGSDFLHKRLKGKDLPVTGDPMPLEPEELVKPSSLSPKKAPFMERIRKKPPDDPPVESDDPENQ